MNCKRIVITGAPGTGKTSVIRALEHLGHFCFHEIIRDMTLEAKEVHPNGENTNPIAFVSDAVLFNTTLINGRLSQFLEAEQHKGTVFYDRGMPDVLAYMACFKQKIAKDFSQLCQDHSYDMVFILPPWEAIYVQDNERLETYAQALEIHKCLMHTYADFGYTPSLVPFGAVEDRVAYVINEVHGKGE